MIINRFVSVREIILDVYRNTGSTIELPWADLIYWSYEALELLRQPQQYVAKVAGYNGTPELDITNYKAKLPCDFHKLVQIMVNGMPARYTNDTFHHLLGGACCGVIEGTNELDLFNDQFGNIFSPQGSTVNSINVYDSVTFDINNDYLTLSAKKGKVCIAYLAHPTDDEGFPMVPDDMSYRVAVTKYLMMKLAYLDWIKDPANKGKQNIFEYNEREWNWYSGQATSTVKMPDLEQMESLKNQVIRMIPNINEHDSFFKFSGAKQIKRIK